MDKRTVIAVVLSVTVMVVWFILVPGPKQAPGTAESTTSTVDSTAEPISQSASLTTLLSVKPIETETSATEAIVDIETDLVIASFTSIGGDLISYKLKKHKDNGSEVELVYPWEDGSRAFTISLGDGSQGSLSDIFNVNRVSDTVVEFWRDYAIENSDGTEQTFRLSKRWEFVPAEYLFELNVTIDGKNNIPNLSSSKWAYTLEYGPQLGPVLKNTKSKSRYQDYREFWTYRDGKVKKEKIKGPLRTSDERIVWTGIVGKYFLLTAIPDATQYTYSWDTSPAAGLDQGTRLRMSRPALKGSKTVDSYRFYLGPKVNKDLALYNSADKNEYRMSNMHFDNVLTSWPIIGQMEFLMKWILMLFHKIIPNYGVAIILLTILVKALMFPITRKGSESTLRMQTLSPKIKEIQEKFKDNPAKMNAEMAELYKREGYNPLSGCLPMIIQIPIFLAMYNLFNNHFDLRGAMFIPGWIPDLSQPEFVWSFAPFKIPLLGWSELRILPFIYLGSQLLYGRVNQTAGQQGNTQMMLMMYGMPIMFFFILYDVPAGLLIYWIMSNSLSLVQQIGINKYLKVKRAEMGVETAAKSAILPPGKRKKKK